MARRTHAPARGFTLIEALVTIAIVVILGAVATPSFRQLIANQRIKTASFDLFSALTYARSEAIQRNADVTLRAGAAVDGAWSTGWRVVDSSGNILRSWGAISNLSVTEGASVALLTFNRNGRPTAAPKLQIASTVSASGVTARCIQISLSGRPTTATGNCP